MNAFLRATMTIAKKELAVELRTREILFTAGIFGVLVVMLTSLAFVVDEVTSRRIAPGVLWVSVAFAGVLAMGRSWARERDADAIRGLLLAPIPRSAIFAGKGIGTFAIVVLIELGLLPLVGVLYHLEVSEVVGPVAGILFVGTLGYVAMGTLFGAMSVRTQARDLMLSVVLLPLAAPALLAGVVSTREYLGGASFEELLGWFRILIAFDLVAVVSGLTLFEWLIED